MIEKILQGYMEKLHNLIPDEIREFVECKLEAEDCSTSDYFISLCINTKKPKQYKIFVDDEEIKITDVSEKTKNISEDELLKDFETIAEKSQKLCVNAGIPTINPAIKKLLTVAKEIRNEFPEEIRWLVKIEQSEKKVALIFPRNLEEVQKEIPQGMCKIEFIWNNKIMLSTYEGIHNNDEKKEPWEVFGEKIEATKTLLKFFQNLLNQLEN